jgi:flagellar motility protein MotE (MotC chaperone)
MKPRVRLLPIVIVATSGLLVLKATALITSGEVFLSETTPPKQIRTEEDLPRFARVLARMRFIPPPADPEITGSVPPKKEPGKKDAGKEAEKTSESKPVEQASPDPQKTAEARQGVQPLPQSATPTERALLERLQERRGSIDDRARELEMRENLLKAAEKKVDGRIGELKDIEGRIDGSAKAQQAEAEKQMKSIVIMYETMKPKEAARVFERLNLQVLVPIATTMKPARMAEILAAMSPESAEKLTVALARPVRTGAAAGMSDKTRVGDVEGELPSLVQPSLIPPPGISKPR